MTLDSHIRIFIVRQDPEQGHKDQTDWSGSPGQGQIARLRKVIWHFR